MESSSNPCSTEEVDRFLDALDEFYYDCFPIRRDTHRQYSSLSGIPSAAGLRRRRSTPRGNMDSSDVEIDSSCSSNGFEFGEKSSYMEKSEELKGDFETSDQDSEVTESTEATEKENDWDVINSYGDKGKDIDVTDSGRDRDRVGPFQEGTSKSGEKTEESRVSDDSDVTESTKSAGKENNWDVTTSSGDKGKDVDVTDSGRVGPFQEETSKRGEKTEESTVSDDRGDEYAGSMPQLQETNSTDWSLLGYLAGLVMKAIEFQVSMMISFITYPPWFLYCCSLLVLDPFSTIKLGRRFLMKRVAWISDMIFGTMNPFKLSCLKDTKRMMKIVCKFGWGLFWAVYVGVVLIGMLVSSLMLGGFVINRIADKPFVIKESLNFDYTKNSPEAFVPITSCAGVACDGSCKESNEMWKIRGLRVIPQDHTLEITLSMTLPESPYNKNLGMFQVRVDMLSADGERLDSIRRPCMLKFRSEPIRLVQTFFKMVPLVTGYVSEIQTLSLKLKGFVEKEIPTACLKIMMEQRAEFRPGAGIPELYDAFLLLESDLPFFKRVIWKWRKTLFVWISMSLFVTELLFALVCCRPLIIPRRTQRRDRDRSPSNQIGSR